MKLLPLRNNVMFQFLDATGGAKGRFTDRATQSGIIIATHDNNQKIARWGQVVAAGPDAQVQVGDYIFVEALMWSYGVTLDDGEKVWKTDDTKILFVTDNVEDTRKTTPA